LHLVEVVEGYQHQEGEGRVVVLKKNSVEPGSRERGPTKSLRRPAETRRRYKPRSARRKMLMSEAEATWRRASARFIGRRDLVDDTLRLVVTKGWEKRKHIKIGVAL
jgi:hypothetical protein